MIEHGLVKRLMALCVALGLLLFCVWQAGSAGALASVEVGQIPADEKGAPQVPASPVGRTSKRLPGREAEILDLEAGVKQAELILAVRLVDVTDKRIVHGGLSEQVTQQYRFEPVKVLKGIFARSELQLTGQDLGIYRFSASSEKLEAGQLFLVLLGQQNGSLFNCNGVASLSQSIPRLGGLDDPLLATVGTLISVCQTRDRMERVTLLREALKKASGRDASTLLRSLTRRSVVASRVLGVVDVVAPLLRSPSPYLREVAAETITALFEAYTTDGKLSRVEAVNLLVESLKHADAFVAARVATINAIGQAGEGLKGEFKGL